MRNTHSDVCDLMKQVMLISEPFTARDLAYVVTVSAPTASVWLRALEDEGLLVKCGEVSSPFNSKKLHLYKRFGAFAK